MSYQTEDAFFSLEKSAFPRFFKPDSTMFTGNEVQTQVSVIQINFITGSCCGRRSQENILFNGCMRCFGLPAETYILIQDQPYFRLACWQFQ